MNRLEQLKKEYEAGNNGTKFDYAIKSKKYNWVCDEGHKFSATMDNRMRVGTNCPVCANRVVLKGFNDLESCYPDVAAEWHPTKNNGLKPDEVVYGSAKKVWWQCSRGHEWEALVRSRTNMGHGCPHCSGGKTSFPEQVIYVTFANKTEAFNRVKVGGYEYDIYIPEFKLAIEYDGLRFHNTEEKEDRFKKKREFAVSKGVRLLRILEVYEGNLKYIKEEDTIYYRFGRNRYENIDELIGLINSIVLADYGKDLGLAVDTKIKNEATSKAKKIPDGESFGEKYPELLIDWDYEKNEGISPYDIHAGSGAMVWFKCHSCGNEYQQYIRRAKSGCQKCKPGGKKGAAIGINDLGTLYPRLLEEWAYDLNEDLDPKQIRPNSNKKVWWRCSKCGNEWEAHINHRVRSQTGCPACRFRILKEGLSV